MDLGLVDRRFLVGGVSRGLGAAVARALLAEGARVAGISRQPPEPAPGPAGSFTHLPIDLAQADGPASAVEAAVTALGGLDGLLVNTGGPPVGTFAAVDEAAWQKAIDGTLHSTLRLIRAALPHLQAGRDPSIAIILSSSIREPVPSLVTSNVLRPGLAGLIKSLPTEIAPIRINGIAPGRFDTDRVRSLDDARAASSGLSLEEIRAQWEARIPLGRYGDPDELGRVAAFVLSPVASYVNGVTLLIDGGLIRSLP